MKIKREITARLICGFAFTLIGAVFLIVGVSLYSIAKFTAIHAILGAVFLGLGLGLLHIEGKKNIRIQEVVEEGNYVIAKITEIRQDMHIEINGTHPYVIDCVFRDPETGMSHLFTSRHYVFDPAPYLSSSEVRVYIDPENLSDYSVDSDAIINRVSN